MSNITKGSKYTPAIKKDLKELKCCIQKELQAGNALYAPTSVNDTPIQVGTLNGTPVFEITVAFTTHATGAALALPVSPTNIIGWSGYVVTAGGGGSEFALPNNNSSIAHTSGAATLSAFVHIDHASADGIITLRYQ